MKCKLCEQSASHRKLEPTGEVNFYCATHAPTGAAPMMGPQSTLSQVSGKTYIIVVVVALIAVITLLSFPLSKKEQSSGDDALVTVETPAAPAPVTPESVALGIPGTANRFFSFVDSFTKTKDLGVPQVTRMVPELDLIGFVYGTSQESSQFGVYNYSTNELFTGIGASNYTQVQQIAALLPNNQMVIWSSPGIDAAASARPQILVIDYTTKAVIKTITVPQPAPKYLHQAFNFNTGKNKGSLILKNTFDHTESTLYQTWELNMDTWELKRVEPLG